MEEWSRTGIAPLAAGGIVSAPIAYGCFPIRWLECRSERKAAPEERPLPETGAEEQNGFLSVPPRSLQNLFLGALDLRALRLIRRHPSLAIHGDFVCVGEAHAVSGKSVRLTKIILLVGRNRSPGESDHLAARGVGAGGYAAVVVPPLCAKDLPHWIVTVDLDPFDFPVWTS